MARELINAQITHVSYVDKGANQKRFFLTKSAEDPTFQKEVKVFINKEDAEQKLVYGVVYEPDVKDSHDDFMTAAEIEKSAHGFLKDARNIDTQHDFEAGVGEVVESYIAPTDFVIGDESIKKGAWVLVTKASNEIWESIKKGGYTGYSLAGTAETIEKKQKEEPVSKSQDDTEMKGFFKLLKNFFTGEKVEKGEIRDKYDKNQKERNLWSVWDGMENAYYESIWDNETPDVADFDRIEAAAEEFLVILKEIKGSGDVAKALEDKPESLRKGEDNMNEEEIAKLIDEKLDPITKKLEELEGDTDLEKAGVEPTAQELLVKQFSEALDSKLGPISERLDTVEKARGISKQAEKDQNDPVPVEKHYLDGFI